MIDLKIVALIVALNSGLAIVSKGLGFIKDRTKTKLDNKAFLLVSKLMGYGQRLVDFIGGNVKH
jgi:hypothetical protein